MNQRLNDAGLRKALSEAGGILPELMNAFVFGGGAMAFRNQKATTKDVDMVFEEPTQARAFAGALQKIGFTEEKNLAAPYELMHATGGIWIRGDSRFDVFGRTVMGKLALTPSMKRRSTLFAEFGNLAVHLLSNEDVAFFKAITNRPGDVDDIAAIASSTNLDWNVILEECKRQSVKRTWYGAVYNQLAELKRLKIDAPIQQELLRLDETSILAEAFKRRLQAGKSREQARKELRAEGASEEDLKRLDAFINGKG